MRFSQHFWILFKVLKSVVRKKKTEDRRKSKKKKRKKTERGRRTKTERARSPFNKMV